MALQFLIAGAHAGETGLFVTFEEFPQTLYRDASSLGFDLHALEDAGMLHIVFTSPAVLLKSLQDSSSRLHRLIVEREIRRLAVDSVSHFIRVSQDSFRLRKTYTSLINSFRREGITALLLSEERKSEYRCTDPGGLAYLSDGIILLRYVEVESDIHRAIVVLKLRGSDHAREIRRYTIDKGGLVIGDVFRRREAILRGISRPW